MKNIAFVILCGALVVVSACSPSQPSSKQATGIAPPPPSWGKACEGCDMKNGKIISRTSARRSSPVNTRKVKIVPDYKPFTPGAVRPDTVDVPAIPSREALDVLRPTGVGGFAPINRYAF